MWDPNTLEVLVRVIGLVTALLGAAAAVPGAVWRLKDRAADGVKAVKARLSRQRPKVRHVSLADVGTAVDTLTVGVLAPNTPEERIAALEQRATAIEGSVRDVQHDLQVESEVRKDADTRIAGQIEELRTALHNLEKVGTEIDADALPIVVIGILLTSIGDWIANSAWMAGISIIVGAGLSVYALLILARSRPGRHLT